MRQRSRPTACLCSRGVRNTGSHILLNEGFSAAHAGSCEVQEMRGRPLKVMKHKMQEERKGWLGIEKQGCVIVAYM